MLSNGDATILLTSLSCDSDMFEKAKDSLDDPVFDPAGQFAHDYIFRNLVDISEEAGCLVTQSMLGSRLSDALSDMPAEHANWVPGVQSLYAQIVKAAEPPPNRDYVMQLMQLLANEQLAMSGEQIMASVLERASPGEAPGMLNEEMGKLVQRKTINTGGKNIYVQPFKALRKLLVNSKPWPTGITWFDDMSGGGARSRKLWGLLAPSGGGKTTFASQLSVSWSRQSEDHHVFLALYEQPPEGDITARLLGLAMNEEVDKFRECSFDDMPEETQRRALEMSKPLEDRVHILNFSEPGEGLRGLADIQEALEKAGKLETLESMEASGKMKPPVIVVLDWFLPMISRMMASSGAMAVGGDLRGYGLRFMDEIKVFKNKYNVLPLITHQLNPTASGSSAARAPTWNDAAEWKGFAWMMDDCYAVGNRTEEDVAIMLSSKARAHASNKMMVRLDGARSRFLDVSSEFMVSNGRMVKKTMQTVRGSSSAMMAARIKAKLPKSATSVVEEFNE